MYSNEDRIKAIKLYIEYDYCARAVIRELGYPSRNRLAKWFKEYQERGSFDYGENRHSKYSPHQRQTAIDFYLNNGRSIRHTIKALGYPGKSTLCDWLNEEVANEKRKWSCKASRFLVRCTKEQKEQAVKDYCLAYTLPLNLVKYMALIPIRYMGGKTSCSVRRIKL